MRVAFVGVKRKYQELPEDYQDAFTRYHLELPWYYASGGMEVIVTTPDFTTGPKFMDDPRGILWHVEEKHFNDLFDDHSRNFKYDVVVHWRKWFPEFYRPEAINVINCQDHSFSPEWKATVVKAYAEKKLYGILCFPKWHKQNLYNELNGAIDGARLIDGLTLGVDTDIYAPAPDKDPYQLLWSSDPGRGLQQMLRVFAQLRVLDRRFHLNVCWPDYCQFAPTFNDPTITWHGNVPNGPALWGLFNKCGVLAYPSTFKEPSSRAHRQAMAAGSMVFYPPNMGTPSDLIVDGQTGFVKPVAEWPVQIFRQVIEGGWKQIGDNARRYAISENWAVQAQRFRQYFEAII